MMKLFPVLMVLLMGAMVSSAVAQPDAHGVTAHESTVTHDAGAAHAGEHGPKYKLMTLDAMAAVWTIIVFIGLMIVLRLAAWKPIQKVLMDREKFISDALAKAQADREAAEARLKEYEEKLAAAGAQVAAIMEEARRDATVLKRREEQQAREEAERTIERAKREIELATDTAVKELYAKSAGLATEIASRVIGKELDAAQHERLIAESIEELQAVGS